MSESDHTIVTTKILKTNLHLSMTQEYSVNNTNQLGKTKWQQKPLKVHISNKAFQILNKFVVHTMLDSNALLIKENLPRK